MRVRIRKKRRGGKRQRGKPGGGGTGTPGQGGRTERGGKTDEEADRAEGIGADEEEEKEEERDKETERGGPGGGRAETAGGGEREEGKEAKPGSDTGKRKEVGDKAETTGSEESKETPPTCNWSVPSYLTSWPRPRIRGNPPHPPELTTPIAKELAACTFTLGGGTSTCVIGSTLPEDSVSGTPVGESAPRPPATSSNREALFGTAGGAENNGVVPS